MSRKRTEGALGSPSPSPGHASVRRSDTMLTQATAVLNSVLDGYEVPADMVRRPPSLPRPLSPPV